jgi:hypothetical protein
MSACADGIGCEAFGFSPAGVWSCYLVPLLHRPDHDHDAEREDVADGDEFVVDDH